YRLGKLLYEGKEVKQDISKAIDNLKQAAAKDNIYADYLLAKIYLTESSVRDIGAAINHLKRTAETAQPKDKQQRTMRGFAQYQLGKLYYFGTDGMEKNEQLGLEYLTAAAAAGNQSAAQMLTSIQQHRQTAAAMCSLNLMQNVANLITEKTMAAGMQYNHGQSDRREMSKIIDKKLAQGLKTG
ncbi:MAG: hypothetical protein LUH82_06030, partial [Clostridiales bacterium]|nr:hypothetical protein [Clostridiales bacterium]